MGQRNGGQNEREMLRRIQDSLFHLQMGLTPFVAEWMERKYGANWRHHASSAFGGDLESDLDAYGLLKTTLDNWNSVFGEAFDRRDKHKARSFTSLVLEAPNAVSHHPQSRLDDAQALRYLDAIHQLLILVKAPNGSIAEVKVLYDQQRRVGIGDGRDGGQRANEPPDSSERCDAPGIHALSSKTPPDAIIFPLSGPQESRRLGWIRCVEEKAQTGDRLTRAHGFTADLARVIEQVIAEARSSENSSLQTAVKGDPRTFTGESFGLALAIADRRLRYGSGGDGRRIIATGRLPVGSQGQVVAIDSFAEKMRLILEQNLAPAIFVYPKENLETGAQERQVAEGLLGRLGEKGVECRAAGHIDDAGLRDLWGGAPDETERFGVVMGQSIGDDSNAAGKREHRQTGAHFWGWLIAGGGVATAALVGLWIATSGPDPVEIAQREERLASVLASFPSGFGANAQSCSPLVDAVSRLKDRDRAHLDSRHQAAIAAGDDCQERLTASGRRLDAFRHAGADGGTEPSTSHDLSLAAQWHALSSFDRERMDADDQIIVTAAEEATRRLDTARGLLSELQNGVVADAGAQTCRALTEGVGALSRYERSLAATENAAVLDATRLCEAQLRTGNERLAMLADKLHEAGDFSSPSRLEALLRTWDELSPFAHSLASPEMQTKVVEAKALLSAREERLSHLTAAITAWEASQSASSLQIIFDRLTSLNVFDVTELRVTAEQTLEKARTLKERADWIHAQRTALDVSALGWFVETPSNLPAAIDVSALLRETINAEGWRLVADRMEADVILHLTGQERQSVTTVGSSQVKGARVEIGAEARWFLDGEILFATRARGNGASSLTHRVALNAAWRTAVAELATGIIAEGREISAEPGGQ